MDELMNRRMLWVRMTHKFGWAELGLLVILFLLVLNKLPYLNLPYFWDEAWVYAPAVLDLYDHGLRFSPNAIDPELSRGHPILFHFLAATWLKVFGTSFVAAHSFSVFTAALLIISVFRLGTQMASKAIGFWGAAFVSMNPLLIQQSGLLLPEVLLSLFVTLTLYFHLKNNWLGYALAATAMILTKETGVLVVGAIGLVQFADTLVGQRFTVRSLRNLLFIIAPIVIAGLYFVVQYVQFGWFVFPDHMSLFDTSAASWAAKREQVFTTVFWQQQRPVLIGVTIASLIFGWNRGPSYLRTMWFIIALTVLSMNGLHSWLPGWYYYWVFPALCAVAIIGTSHFLDRASTNNRFFLMVVSVTTAMMILFTSAHFLTGRYLLFLYPMLTVACLAMLQMALEQTVWLRNGILLTLGLWMYHYTSKADGRMQAIDNMRYLDQLHVFRDGMTFLEQNATSDHCIAAPFIAREALIHREQGYRNTETVFACIEKEITSNVAFVLTLSFDQDGGVMRAVETDSSFVLVWETTKGKHHAKVFKRQ